MSNPNSELSAAIPSGDPGEPTAATKLQQITQKQQALKDSIAATQQQLYALNRQRLELMPHLVAQKRATGVWPDWQILFDADNGNLMRRQCRFELRELATLEGFTGLVLAPRRDEFVIGVRLVSDWPQFNALVLEGLEELLPYLPAVRHPGVKAGVRWVQLESAHSVVLPMGGPDWTISIEEGNFNLMKKWKVVESRKSLKAIIAVAAKLAPSYGKRESIPVKELPY